jgi:hypothetical protein
MSDYLWDKTGETEEDVERLERVLGRFRHRPRALELPAESEGFARAGLRAPRAFRTAWLAAAAVLLLFVLAGALFVIRRGASGVGGETQTAARVPQGTTGQDAPRQATPPTVAESGSGGTTRDANEVAKHDERNGPNRRDARTGNDVPTVKDDRTVRQVIPREPERRPGGGEVASKQGGGAAGARHNEREVVSAGTPPRVVSAAASLGEGRAEKPPSLNERRQQAKDELMYALRLTGLKLKDVQRKTQKVDGRKSAFDEQKRIR